MSNYCRDCLHDEMCCLTHCSLSVACCDFVNAERYHEIMQAEREGRLVILPVSFAEFNSKVGDDIYVIDDEEIIEATLCYFIFDQNCKVQGLAIYGCVGDEDFEEYEFSHDDLGKTVFLTREEAEKALEEANG